jgi:hypothetical protein
MVNPVINEKSDSTKLPEKMISHYGLFWKEADVLWSGKESGLKGKSGEPLGRRGRPTVEQSKTEKDYKDFIGLYCLYGEGELIYIGEAGLKEPKSDKAKKTLFSRLKSHRNGSLAGRWDSFSWFGRQRGNDTVSAREALQQLEAVAIAIINPGFNKQSGAFLSAKQIYQVPHPDSEGDVFTRLARIDEMLRKILDNSPAGK